MKIVFHRSFDKQFKKLRLNERHKAKERIQIFTAEPFHSILRNHALKGKYQGLRSINITGDLRAVYDPIEKDVAFFVAIDTHSNLYK